MASPFTELGDWQLVDGYVADVIRGMAGDFMARGSENGMVTGTGMTRAFRGPLLVAGKIGSRLLFNVDQNYAGLGDGVDAGAGSAFNIRQLLAAIGAGQVNFNGAAVAGFTASSTLSFVKKTGVAYVTGPTTGPFQAGHAQPEAPFIYAKDNPSAGHSAMSGAVVMFQWRVSSITGQVSLASLPSNVLTLSNQDVIAELAEVDSNGQDITGLGVVKIGFRELGVGYELPISLGGEVLESTLTATEDLVNPVIVIATDVVDVTTPVFTANHIGWRIAFGTTDSYIIQVNSTTQVQIADTSAGGDAAAAGEITYAVDGILRAVEVSWTNEALFGQALIPDKAFPPGAGQFAGVMNDRVWLDAEGIIYISEPGQLGSFPPKNAIFAPEPAVTYLAVEDGVTLRFGKTRTGALYYVGGPIEYQTIIENQGVLFPQNVFLGYGGRPCAWFGKPTVIKAGSFETDFDYAARVISEFEGWAEGQTADKPIAGGYEGLGQFECWCFGKKVMAKHGPTGKWCSPTDLTDLITGDIVDAVTVNIEGIGHALYLACLNGVDDLTLYQYDAGTGSVMKVQTSDISRMNYGGDVTMIMSEGRVDNIASPVRIQLVTDYNNGAPLADPLEGEPEQTPSDTGDQSFRLREPNAIDAAGKHSVLVTMTSTGGDTGLNRIKTFGSTDDVETR